MCVCVCVCVCVYKKNDAERKWDKRRKKINENEKNRKNRKMKRDKINNNPIETKIKNEKMGTRQNKEEL